MNKTKFLIFSIFAFLSLCSPVFAQSTINTVPVRFGASLPATCQPAVKGKVLFYKTGASNGLYYCSAANTWTAVNSGGGGGGASALDDLSDVAIASPADDNVLQRVSGTFVNRTPAQLKSTLSLTKSDVGLSNADNTSDAAKNAASATLTNKTLSAPVLSGTVTGTYTLGGTPTFPATVVSTTGTQTLTNKTLTAPVISTVSNTGTLTLPTATDTLVGRATTDTLTNKTISGASNTVSNIAQSSVTNLTTDLAAKAAITATVNAQTGTTYTIQSSDNGKIVTLSNASAITVTLPSGLPVGFNCILAQIGAGQVTVSPSSTTLNHRESHTKTAGQYASATIFSYATNIFLFGGDTAL